MPLVGYICPPNAPTNQHQRPGQRNKIAHCLGTCPAPCVSPPLLAAMYEAEHRNHHKGSYLSASMIANETSCPRQVWFERQPDIEVYEPARRRFWPFRGTIIHALVEGSGPLVAPFGWMQELRMAVPLVYEDLAAPVFNEAGDFTGDYDDTQPLTIMLGGTTDCYNPYLRHLHDFKTVSDLKIYGLLNGEEGGRFSQSIKDSWVLQTNIYGWLVSQTHITEEMRAEFRKYGLPELEGDFLPTPTSLEMQVISMMDIPLTGRGYQHKYKAPGKSRAVTTDYTLESVPVLPAAEIEAYVRTRALDWFEWLVLGVKPDVVRGESSWLCYHCPFNGEKVQGGPCMPTAERERL